MSTAFPHLLSPFRIRHLTFKNRIFVPAHGSGYADGGCVTDRHLAYLEARAKGGAAAIVTEAQSVDPDTYKWSYRLLCAADDRCIPGLRRLAEMGRRHDCRVLGQLLHEGRAATHRIEGLRPVPVAPSDVPDERFKSIPLALSVEAIWRIVGQYGDAGRRLVEAGLDGIEILAGVGYLPSQFLSPRANRREDAFGGDPERRLRFVREVVADIRRKVGEGPLLGLRFAGEEGDRDGLDATEARAVILALAGDPAIDYVNITTGSTNSLGGATMIVPPMFVPPGPMVAHAAAIKAASGRPVFVGGRINQPQEAERILASGQADMIGMVRAHIADPEFVNKVAAGRPETIRACIACNQACIGHRHMGFGVSCIQFPETGREERFAVKPRAARPRSVLVAGGGPAGLKAAAVAAERGHRVTLCERDRRLGGQALLASALPRRAEFGGIVTNLAGEAERAGVRIRLGVEVTPALVTAEAPEVVIVATGAGPRMPEIEGAESAHVIDAWDVIAGTANPGPSVAVADWRCDWTGLGVAEKLARDGCHVRLFVAGIVPGEMLQAYVRDQWIGELHRLGVVMVPYAQAFGVDGSTAYFRHMSNGDPILCEGVDTLVMAQAPERRASLAEALTRFAGRVVAIGDCLSPRSAEEAVYEGLEAAMAI
jgi:2,4-dienoyl-CoA reductase-like NADH-dependent reductase (Old Yellow Enzyme family)